MAMRDALDKKICSICFLVFEEFGNNPEPVNSGWCCDHCNKVVVLIARLNKLDRELPDEQRNKT